jgi:hypothetical protein
MLIMSNIGDQVWLITSRQTEPDLSQMSVRVGVARFELHPQFIYVRVEYPVHEAYARTLVGVLIWELDMHFPKSALKRC